MKKIVVLMILFAFCTATQAQKQERVEIKTNTIDLADVQNVFEAMGIDIFSFDLSEVAKTPQKMWVYVDQYCDSTVTEIISIPVKRNIRYVDDYPAEVRDQVRKDQKMKKNEQIVSRVDKLNLYFIPKNDSTIKMKVELANYGSMTRELKLRQVVTPNYSTYFYSVRPFKLGAIEQNKKTPLVLYGSGWFDKEANIVRMCGERTINPDLSKNKILDQLPHYYVVGIKIEKTDE